MYFKQFFDEKLAQYAYLIGCQANGTALIIDPMRDIDQYIEEAARQNLTIVAATDTHIHADYLSGLREFAERGVKVYASDEGDKDWKYEWLIGSDYNYRLLKNGDKIEIGNITIQAWHTPGHTPEHLSYYITDGATADEPLGIATGDFVFVGDVGRPDLLESAAGKIGAMEPSARTLYKSVESFKSVPEYLQIWPGHGAGSACGKALGAVPDSTVGYELRYNNSIKSATSEDNFVNYILEGQPEPPLYFARMKRDNKSGPKLLNGLPQPGRLGINEIEEIIGQENTTILDSRTRQEFTSGHLPGSILSPFSKQFNTVAGSYIRKDEKIILVIEKENVSAAVLDLIRIGLDHIEGYLVPSDLERYASEGGKLSTMRVETFDKVEEKKNDDDFVVVDVRKASEYSEGHVENAVNIAHTRLLDRMNELPDNKTLLVHCRVGGRSAVASALLAKNGYDVVLIDDDLLKFYDNQKDTQLAT